MKTYESYKESGVETIGEIPMNWNVLSIKHIAEIIGRIGFRGYTVEDIVSEGEGAISLSPSNILSQKLDLKKKTFLSWDKYEESPEIKITEGDVILVKTASVGKVAYVDDLKDYKATLNPQLIVFKNIKLNSKYFYYLLISDVIQKKIESDTNGGVVGTLTQKAINSYQILQPTDSEQTQIANYLDHKTQIIDALIEKKEQLIKKLQAQRQAIINEAVTKGLNPNAKLKESGIEWLGKIPEHWEVVKLKFLVSNKLKYGANESAEDENKEDPRYIRITDFGNDGNLKKNTFKSLPMDKAEEYLLKEGDILFARSGATVGKTFQFKNYNGLACFAGYLIKATVNHKILSDFLYYFTKSNIYENWKNSIFIQATIQNISAEKYNNLEITIPPTIREQQIIINHIKKKANNIDEIIKNSNVQIKKLKVYRQSIISEAVTGKIDVRDWQAKTT